MTDLELIFTMLGEASTTEIAKKKDAKGFPENKKVAREGGTIAGNARKELEKKSGTKVSTKTNYKELSESKSKLLKDSKRIDKLSLEVAGVEPASEKVKFKTLRA